MVAVRDRQRNQAILELEQLRARDRVLRPGDARLAIRVQVGELVDEVVGHVAIEVDVQQVRTVELWSAQLGESAGSAVCAEAKGRT